MNRKRPPQGTHRIESKRSQDRIKSLASGIVTAFYLELKDSDFRRFAEAKQNRDQKGMGDAIAILREKYDEKFLLKAIRSIR